MCFDIVAVKELKCLFVVIHSCLCQVSLICESALSSSLCLFCLCGAVFVHLALHHDDPAFVVNANSARMLKDVRAKLSHKLTVLVVYLDLMRRRPKKQH